MIYRKSFDSDSIRVEVWPENGRKRRDAVDGAVTPVRFRGFAAERFIRSKRMQKQNCRALNEL